MSRFHSYVNTAKTILSLYKGDLPFSIFIKSYFSNEKKYGSRDRRIISSLCYNYFRTGNATSGKIIEEKLLIGQFLCTNVPNEMLQNEKPDWNEKAAVSLPEKLEITGITANNIFPFNDELSENIDTNLFNTSFLIQPEFFIRLRNKKQETTKQKLKAAQILFKEFSPDCLAFANATKLEEVVAINDEAVIQDFNSQRTGEFIAATNLPAGANVWDCCAASGGKSIMAHDVLADVRLTVSDVRASILHNLRKRFNTAGIKNYQSFAADCTDSDNLQKNLNNKKFNLIICDAPCSGSGTWSRTPEQLLFFKKEEIAKYSLLQKDICTNTSSFLKKGGFFLYITCSVFKKENEEIRDFIQEKCHLLLIKTELLKGYNIRADSMFAALFQA